jgi:hypothetical protein
MFYQLQLLKSSFSDQMSSRGTNDTLLFDCYGSPEARATIPIPPSGNSSNTARGQIWAEATVRANTCAIAGNDTGRFLGTAFLARDHHAVATAMGEGNSFRYWGKYTQVILWM